MNMAYAKGKQILEGAQESEKRHRAKRDRIRKERADVDVSGTLRSFWADSGRTSAVLAHNGIVLGAWCFLMFLVAYAALQLAFYFVAIVLGQTGGILMESTVDVITVYVVIAMVCGFDMFFSFAIEKACIRAMCRRFWKVDRRHACIDKGDLWREKHAPFTDGTEESQK